MTPSPRTIERLRDPQAMADRFGEMAVQVMRAGLAARNAARMAAHYAELVLRRQQRQATHTVTH